MRVVSRVVLMVALVWLAPHVARADSIVVGDAIVSQQLNPDGLGGAGPFITTVNGDPASAFITFCVQPDVGTWEDLGTTQYVAGVSSYVTWEPPDMGGDANGMNFLTSQTAWLYTQFRDGTLAGYDQSTNAGNALQFALWQLQNDLAVPQGLSYSALANSFVTLAEQAVANGFTGIGDVRVLNLVNADGTDAQDQLTMVPEPSSFELLALGAIVLFVGRRRFAVNRAHEFA
jgi:hypothetical protein